jgi:hypothetical protein
MRDPDDGSYIGGWGCGLVVLVIIAFLVATAVKAAIVIWAYPL